ncbi:MAG: DUF2948 family protein [Caulobacterales bacterium]|jgi:hypothetical protein
MSAELLKLKAEDSTDLEVISAAVQDGVVKIGDILFDARQRRFALALNRFRWESDKKERIRAALAFEDVLKVQTHKLRTAPADAVAAILALRFLPDAEPPGGRVEIALSGGGGIRITVEVLDASLRDFGAPWPARATPSHEES